MKYKCIAVETHAGRAAISMRIADDFITRLMGLFSGEKLVEGEAIYLSPCNAVHTIGMRYFIDVLFLDNSNRIIKVERNVKKNSFHYCRDAKHTVEMLAGEIDRLGIITGKRFIF